MSGRLVHALGSSSRTSAHFSDAATLRHMLRFEAALAHAVAAAGLIPKKHAATIEAACDAALYDPGPLAEAARRTATLTVPVVKAGDTVAVVGFTFNGEKGDPVLRAEYLFFGGKAYGLRSSPA